MDASARVNVTPYAGVWIEIVIMPFFNSTIIVTPYAGVWIEISFHDIAISYYYCHSLRGSVD